MKSDPDERVQIEFVKNLGDLALIGKLFLEISIINHINYINKKEDSDQNQTLSNDSEDAISKQ